MNRYYSDRQITYTFKYIAACNMCGSDVATHKVLGKRLNDSQGRKPKSKAGISTSILKCSNCGLIYSQPQPIPANIQDHYGVPPESYWHEDFFEVEPGAYKALSDKAISLLLNFEKGMKALDIGAGLGKCMISLQEEGFDTWGFEPSEPFYQRAIEKMKLSPDRLKLGMIEEMNYPANEFNFITFGAVLEHVYNPAECLEKAYGWLKPGGVIHIEVPSADWFIAKIYNLYYKLIGSDYVTNLSPMHSPFHLYEFTITAFQKYCEQHQMEIANHRYMVCKTYMPKFIDTLIRPYMDVTNQGLQLEVWLRKK